MMQSPALDTLRKYIKLTRQLRQLIAARGAEMTMPIAGRIGASPKSAQTVRPTIDHLANRRFADFTFSPW
jgi:hypothetical protein